MNTDFPVATLNLAKLVLDRERRALDPDGNELDKMLYVERGDQERQNLIAEAQAAAFNERPFRWFFTGHTGAGKSTELNRVQPRRRGDPR